jgi:protein gp37
MSENSKIEWTDHTFNPWEGCQKVSPGCDHCYAETRNARFGGGVAINWGPGAPRRRTSAANWRKPLAWNATHDKFFAEHGRRQRVFCASLADVFDNAVSDDWRADLFELIVATPNLDWLLLTKRIGNVGNMLPIPFDFEKQYPNVWLGATITSQAEADRDVPKLLDLPAAVRFLSMEPLLGPVDLTRVKIKDATHPERGQPPVTFDALSGWYGGAGSPARLDWVIVGGESGPGARPMHPDWARDLCDQCGAAGVPFLFKQWGEWVPRGPESMGYPIIDDVPRRRITDAGHNGQDLAAEGGSDTWMQRAGKKVAGRLLDGAQHDGFPK